MKLTKEEYQSLVDSRLVDLQAAIETFRVSQAIVNHTKNIERLETVMSRSELLLEAYQFMVEAEEQEQIDEAEEKYKNDFLGEG